MKKLIFPVMALAAMTMASCSGSSDANAADSTMVEEVIETVTVTPAPNVQKLQQNKWRLSDYTVGNGVMSPDASSNYVLTFNPDSTFTMTTDCNQIEGMYVAGNDSLQFEGLLIGQMLCPETVIEQAMGQLLPTVNTYRMPNDSTLLLSVDHRTIVATFVPAE